MWPTHAKTSRMSWNSNKNSELAKIANSIYTHTFFYSHIPITFLLIRHRWLIILTTRTAIISQTSLYLINRESIEQRNDELQAALPKNWLKSEAYTKDSHFPQREPAWWCEMMRDLTSLWNFYESFGFSNYCRSCTSESPHGEAILMPLVLFFIWADHATNLQR